MFLRTYRKLSQRDRALMDGRLITYHFYVGGATLIVLGVLGSIHSKPVSLAQTLVPLVSVAFGVTSLLLGAGLHLFHRRMILSADRDSYLATLTAVLGRHRFPIVPSLFGILVVFSVFATALYLVAR